MQARELIRLFGAALAAWWNDNVPRMGASLAYYTLFAIAPVLLVATAVAGLVFGEEAVRGELVGQIDQLVGRDGGRAVQALVEGASRRDSGLVASVVGAVTFLLASTGAFLELQAALDDIWHVKPRPDLNLRAFLADRLRSFGLVLAIGFLLLVSLAVSAAIAAASSWLGRLAPELPLLWNVVNLLTSLLVTWALFMMLYSFLPDVRLEWRDVAVGAFVTAILFTLGKQLIGLYLGQSAAASTYGAAGSVVLLLLWVYYSSQIVLLGAEFTRVYADRAGFKMPVETFAEPDPDAAPRPELRRTETARRQPGIL
jgi:membrane protein